MIARNDPEATYSLADRARVLVALGRVAEATEAVAKAGAEQGERFGFRNAVLYAKLAKLAGARAPLPPDAFLAQVKGAPVNDLHPWFGALTGERPLSEALDAMTDKRLRVAVEITVSAAADPDEALRLTVGANRDALGRLDRTTSVLLAAELYRKGSNQAADLVLDATGEANAPREAIREYLRSGDEDPKLRELDLECQAAVHLVRARALDVAGKPSDELVQTARSEDLLHGVVTLAADHWPRPRPN